MQKTLRHMAGAFTASLTLVSFGFLAGAAQAQTRVAGQTAACTIPAPPAGDELTANPDSSITIDLTGSAGATSYDIYRGTTSGGEATTPVATTTNTIYTDKNLSSANTYFYEFTATNACGQSARSPEDASKTPPPAPSGGSVAGVASGNSELYYCKDALRGGFDWFQTLTGWFPSILGSSGSISPGQQVVDMAYATDGTLTFNNVVVPTSGLYTLDWRYAFQGGLFPGVNNRQMGLAVNGTVITTTERFPITGSFDTYQHSSLQVHLNAGRNSVTLFAVSDHGVSRVDQLTVTPATASAPSGPANLTVTPGNASATLHWTASTSGSPASYTIYRGTKSDGEAVTPVGTVSGTTTTFTDTGLTNGTTYFYNVAANNTVGVSPDSNEVSMSPGSASTIPPAPSGLATNPGNGSIALTWNPSAGAASYSIYRGTAPGAEGTTPVGTATTNSFTDTGLANGTGYYYVVTASSAAGTSGKSSEASTVPTAAAVAPPVPFGVVVTPSSGHVQLQWTYEENATSYRVYRSTTPGGEGATPLATVTSSSYTDSAVTSGVTYYYKFTALTGTTESARSSEYSTSATGTGTLLSQGQPATASSQESASYPPSNAVDGSLSTRWSSAFSDPQWLEVDLGTTRTITQVVLNWETAYATAFQIQTSTDGTTWTTVYSTTTGTGGTQTLPVSGSGRYVRMYGTQRATGYGYSLWEFQVFGS
jgi:fibronectin type 3 domain-containing protein